MDKSDSSLINDIITLNEKCNKQKKKLDKLEKMCDLSLVIILDSICAPLDLEQDTINHLRGIFFQAYCGEYKKGELTKDVMFKTIKEKSTDFMNNNPNYKSMKKLLIDEQE